MDNYSFGADESIRDTLETKLIKESWLKPAEFLQAKEEQKRTKKSLYAAIARLGFMSEEDIFVFFAQHAAVPFVRLGDYKLDDNLLRLFNEAIYRQHLFLPLFKIDNALYTAMANPLDSDFINTIGIQTGADIQPTFCCPSSIIAQIDKIFGPPDEYFNMEDLIVSPQGLNMIPFWRESERVSINLPVEFKPEDKRISLISDSYVSATCTDISESGKAIAIKTFIFIPPQSKILVKFPTKEPRLELSAEVIRSTIEKNGQYFLGAKFFAVNESLVKSILADAGR